MVNLASTGARGRSRSSLCSLRLPHSLAPSRTQSRHRRSPTTAAARSRMDHGTSPLPQATALHTLTAVPETQRHRDLTMTVTSHKPLAPRRDPAPPVQPGTQRSHLCALPTCSGLQRLICLPRRPGSQGIALHAPATRHNRTVHHGNHVTCPATSMPASPRRTHDTPWAPSPRQGTNR